MEEDFAFLQQEAPVAEEPPVEEPKIETPPAEAAPEPVPQPKDDGPTMVPLAALHEVRDELKAVKAKLAERETPAAEPAPDPIENPDGFTRYNAEIARNLAINTKLEVTEDLAREKFGDDVVDKARDWAMATYANDPATQQRILASRNPYRTIVEMYQRDQMVSQVQPDDWAQFQAWKQAQAAAPSAPTAPETPPPPKSIAAAPSAGGVQHVALGEEAIFTSLFKR